MVVVKNDPKMSVIELTNFHVLAGMISNYSRVVGKQNSSKNRFQLNKRNEIYELCSVVWKWSILALYYPENEFWCANGWKQMNKRNK